MKQVAIYVLIIIVSFALSSAIIIFLTSKYPNQWGDYSFFNGFITLMLSIGIFAGLTSVYEENKN